MSEQNKHQFNLFYDYSVLIRDWLKEIMYLTDYAGQGGVDVVYSTPARAFAKYAIETANGQLERPLVVFHLNGMEYIRNENFLGYVRDRTFDALKERFTYRHPILVYRLTYGLTIYTKFKEDADNLLFQIMTFAHPNKRAVKVVRDRHWAEWYASDPRDESNLEPGEYQDVANRYGIDLIVLRAYLPQPIDPESTEAIIKTISVDLNEETLVTKGDTGDST